MSNESSNLVTLLTSLFTKSLQIILTFKMTENEEAEQLQPLFENGRPQTFEHRNNNVGTTSTNIDNVTSNGEHRISPNDVVISVRNAHKSFGKV